MKRNREKSDIWSAAKASKSSQQSEQHSHLKSMTKNFQTHSHRTNSQLYLPSQSPQEINQSNQPEDMVEKPSRKRRGWLVWPLWAALLVLIPGGIGFTATSLLLKLPTAPNCLRIYWPMASASMRLYCAQLEADEKTADSLLKAIALVEVLPDDHSMRPEINRNVEKWALEILKLGEKEFQTGELKGAISIARQIPVNVQAYRLVEERINLWQSIWSEAEGTYTEVERQLKLSNWNQAFRRAVQLTNIKNKYWATTKYEETINQIKLAREESSKLDSAYAALRKGGVDNLLKAIEKAQQINSSSYAYQEAQNLIADAKNKLLKRLQKLIDDRDWQQLLQVANKMPSSLDLQEEVRDWNNLASAGSNAELGTIASLETAIAEAEKIDATRPLYYEAQHLIERWKLEIEDVSYLSLARELAQPGTVRDLIAAIAQAELIPRFNPRYQEAQREIKSWNRKIQIIEDQPFLERAKQLAFSGNISTLQQAIAQASLIAPNRPLYGEAQNLIRQWRSSIERQQDKPFLDQAVALANARNLTAAIEAAQQIRPGRVLYNEAQAKIRGWRREIQAKEDLKKAYQIAETKTPEAIAKAINIARQVLSSKEVRSQSIQAINIWGYELLVIARDRANFSLKEAISIASMIPSEAAAYHSARAEIEAWKKMLKPPIQLPEAPPVQETNF